MRLTIDNLDGLGAIDYSGAVDASEPLTIARTLNAPSTVKGTLCLVGSLPGGPTVPARQGRVEVTSEGGVTLFTGYLTTEPVGVYAGVASAGTVYRYAIRGVSDEWLLDKQSAGTAVGVALAAPGSVVLGALASRVGGARLSTRTLVGGPALGVYVPEAGAAWTGHAGAVAAASYGSYRAVNGVLSLVPVGSVSHALSDGDGTLAVAGLQTAAARELANDVTLSGAMEPSSYWTEVFTGDGTTTAFELDGEPDAPNTGKAALLSDTFDAGWIDLQRWAVTDPGSHIGLSGSGLTLSGGNGYDGQTTLTAIDPVELGGTVVVELDSVTLGAASAGVLGGLYDGATAQANCFAGFNVSQAGGQTVVSPMVNGAQVGTTLALIQGHAYTLRIRLHCAEMLRVKQLYYAMVDGQVEQFGGGLVDAGMGLVFEVRDVGASSNTPMTVLYDGSVTDSPAQATFVAVNSVQLFGSIAKVTVTRTGTCWVQSTDPVSGAVSTRLVGKAGEGIDCTVSSSATGKVTFVSGRVPAPGEMVTVTYRGRRRSVGRLADAASLAAEAAGGSVGTARWVGHVTAPVARSSEDCENAAQAVLSFSTNRAAAVAGSYAFVHAAAAGWSAGDVWPGDVLALTEGGGTTTVLVRSVTVEERGASPEALTYKVSFANEWAEGLGVRLSEALAKDAEVPETAIELEPGETPASPPRVLGNLTQMLVAGASGSGVASALTVDAGVDAPSGGGFEVRRRNGGFGTGVSGSGDLVLRSPVRGFSIPRAAMVETFYVRMYDASTPPLYSRESSAIVTHLPIS